MADNPGLLTNLPAQVSSFIGREAELAEVRDLLDSRYDEIKSGRVKPIDGEAFFERLRQRESKLIKQRSPK